LGRGSFLPGEHWGELRSTQIVVGLLVAVGFDRFGLIVGIENHFGKSTYITIFAPPPGSEHRVETMWAFA